ncbi:anti-sigma factor family protein [candidate division KSB1 bacterium]
MIVCRLLKKDISAFIDNELTGKKERRLLRHLKNCTRCAAELESLQKNNQQLSRYLELREEFIPEPEPFRKSIITTEGSAVQQLSFARKTGLKRSKITEFIKKAVGSTLDGIDESDAVTLSHSSALSGAVVIRIIQAILITLAILLLYAPDLNAVFSQFI